MYKIAPGRSSLSSQSYRKQTLVLKKGLSVCAGACAMVGTVALDGCPAWWAVKDRWKGESKEERLEVRREEGKGGRKGTRRRGELLPDELIT